MFQWCRLPSCLKQPLLLLRNWKYEGIVGNLRLIFLEKLEKRKDQKPWRDSSIFEYREDKKSIERSTFRLSIFHYSTFASIYITGVVWVRMSSGYYWSYCFVGFLSVDIKISLYLLKNIFLWKWKYQKRQFFKMKFPKPVQTFFCFNKRKEAIHFNSWVSTWCVCVWGGVPMWTGLNSSCFVGSPCSRGGVSQVLIRWWKGSGLVTHQ